MGLKARLNRLEADIEWMQWDGYRQYLGLKLEVAKMWQEYNEEMARRNAEAAQAARRKIRPATPPEPPAKPPRPPVEEPHAVAPPPAPTLSPPPPPEPVIQTFDIPEHMQVAPVWWRHRRPEDYDWDDGPDPPADDDDYDDEG